MLPAPEPSDSIILSTSSLPVFVFPGLRQGSVTIRLRTHAHPPCAGLFLMDCASKGGIFSTLKQFGAETITILGSANTEVLHE